MLTKMAIVDTRVMERRRSEMWSKIMSKLPYRPDVSTMMMSNFSALNFSTPGKVNRAYIPSDCRRQSAFNQNGH